MAWFSIDEDDNDNTRFIAYLIAALSTVIQGFGESLYPVLQTPKPERIEALLAWWRFQRREIRVGGEGGWKLPKLAFLGKRS